MAPAPNNTTAALTALPLLFVEPAKRTIFAEPIRRVLTQVHINVSIQPAAVDFLDEQFMLFLGRVFSPNLTTYSQIKDWLHRLLSPELAHWAVEAGDEVLNSAQAAIKKTLEKDSKNKVPPIDVLVFPVDFVYSPNYFVEKLDLDAAVFLTGVLEYLCADILKLAGNYAMNQQDRSINLDVLKSVLLLDPALQETFLRLREEHAVLTLVKLEDTITRDLTVLTKVFGDALKGLKENGQPELFEKTTAILAFHKNVSKLLSADNSFKGIPLVLEHYNTHQVIFFDYLHVFDKVARELNEWRQSKAVQKVFEDRQLTKAAELNFLRLMWKPMPNIYAFYNHTLRLMDLVAEDNENMLLLKKIQGLYESAKLAGAPFGLSAEEADYDLRVPIWQYMDYSELQAKIDGWSGKTIVQCETTLKKEGTMGSIILLNGVRKSKKPKDRNFYLFDKFLVCLKNNDSILSKKKYILKEIVLVSNLKVTDIEDFEDLKHQIEISIDKDTSLIMICATENEKRDWLTAFHTVKSSSQLAYNLERVFLTEAIHGPELPVELRLTEAEYRFAAADNPDNIVFEIGQTSNGIPLIKGATVLKLIERLTFDKYADTNYLIQFLLTYRSFMSPMELLDLLIERFNIPIPKKASAEQQEEFKEKVRRPVHLRVFNVIKNWVDKHFADFKDEVLLKKFYTFLTDNMENMGNMDKAVQALKQKVQKRLDEMQAPGSSQTATAIDEVTPWQQFAVRPPEAVLTGVNDRIVDILALDPLEVARQLTIAEFDIYRVIKPFECLNQRWTKKDKEAEAPNILAMIERFNHVSNWVKTYVVSTEHWQTRAEVLEHFIKIAEKCMDLNNFNAMMEIISGLNTTSINRLKHTWNAISPKAQSLYSKMGQIMSPDKNYANFRHTLHTRQPPCLPYFGMYLTDLTFIEDGNKDLLPGSDLINFSKRRRTAAVITEIQQYQQLPYVLERVDQIQILIREGSAFDDEECYQQSLVIEPRGITAAALGSTQHRETSDSASTNSANSTSSFGSNNSRIRSTPPDLIVTEDGDPKKPRNHSAFSKPKFSTKTISGMLKSVSSTVSSSFDRKSSIGTLLGSSNSSTTSLSSDHSGGGSYSNKATFFTDGSDNASSSSASGASPVPILVSDRNSGRSYSDASDPTPGTGSYTESQNGGSPELSSLKDRSYSLPLQSNATSTPITAAAAASGDKPVAPTPPPRPDRNK